MKAGLTDNDVEDGDDAVHDGHEDGADGVDDGHDAAADGLEDACDLSMGVSIMRFRGVGEDIERLTQETTAPIVAVVCCYWSGTGGKCLVWCL